MIAGLSVKTNEVQSAMGVARVVEGIVISGNGVFKRGLMALSSR